VFGVIIIIFIVIIFFVTTVIIIIIIIHHHQHHYPQMSSLEVRGMGIVACSVGSTCVLFVSPSATATPDVSFDGISFEARLIGKTIVEVLVQPMPRGSYRM
jgi:hypothetical protein